MFKRSFDCIAATILLAGCVLFGVQLMLMASSVTAATFDPGEHSISVKIDGVSRSALIFVSNTDNDCLIIAGHGGGGTAKGFSDEDKADLSRMAESGCVVVAPNGIDKSFNVGDDKRDSDDLAMVDYIMSNIGHERIYMVGLSRGGMWAWWVACNRDIDAIVVVSGTLAADTCPDIAGTSVLTIHGDSDENVPWLGGNGWPSAYDNMVNVVRENNCGSRKKRSTWVDGDRTHVNYACGNGVDIQSVLIENGGHGWPGATPGKRHLLKGEYISQHKHATESVIEFVATH